MIETSTLRTIQKVSCGTIAIIALVSAPVFATFHFQHWAAFFWTAGAEVALAAVSSTTLLAIRHRAAARTTSIDKVTARLQGTDYATAETQFVARAQVQAVHSGKVISSGYANTNKP